jgi:hypothetical protein
MIYSKHGRPVYWPSDALERAADAIRECMSNDCITLARVALEVRGESDLGELLNAPRPKGGRPRADAENPDMTPL